MSFRRLSSTGGATRPALLLVVLAIAALAPAGARADACPNAAERFGASATLPDCRAYELVSPMVKADNSFLYQLYGFPDGEHVVMSTILPLPGAQSGEPEGALSSRTATGWVTTPLSPPQGPGELTNLDSNDRGLEAILHVSFTSDFSAAFVNSPFADDPLDQNNAFNVYRLGIPGGESSLVSLPDTGATTENLYHPPGMKGIELAGSYAAGNSADGSRVFFETAGHFPTAPGTPADTHTGGNEIYERYAGHTYLVGIMPDGSVPSCGAEVGSGGGNGQVSEGYLSYGAISPDGSEVVFHTMSYGGGIPECGLAFQIRSVGGLYLRVDNGTPRARTVQLPGQYFLGRTADGSKIFSSGGESEGGALYEYDIQSETSTLIGKGALMAYSADGSVVYYMAHPSHEFIKGGTYSDSEQQLEVYDNGTTKTVPNAGYAYAGTYYEDDGADKVGYLENLPVVTPDGSKLLFLDRANLTSYNSNGPSCQHVNQDNGQTAHGPEENHCAEAYVYDLTTGTFTCVSCNPSGTPPLADAELFTPPLSNSFVPRTIPLLSEDGSRAFFETTEALVPQDTNGTSDVYEWENGHIYLLSSGTGGTLGVQEGLRSEELALTGSKLVGVSSNGDNVLIATTDRLLPQDIENAAEIYDVRVDGGFPYTPPVYGCDSGQCQGPQTPAPIFAPPPSATFVGLGNPVQETAGPLPKSAKPATCKKGFVKKRGKCVKKPKAKKANRKGKGRK
jgi:hypothetical protein